MAQTAHGATFRFDSNLGSFAGGVTNINVDSPSAEIADMTGIGDDAGMLVLIPTGSWKGGTVSVEFVGRTTNPSVASLVRGYGQLTFASPGFSVTRQVILESGSESAAIGSFVKGSMKFAMTDYYG